jgi:hypothetical protein
MPPHASGGSAFAQPVRGGSPQIGLHAGRQKAYNREMTKLLDQALEIARSLPSDAQDDIARVVLQLAGAEAASPIILSDDERSAIAASKQAASRGEFATEAQVRATWAKHGL